MPIADVRLARGPGTHAQVLQRGLNLKISKSEHPKGNVSHVVSGCLGSRCSRRLSGWQLSPQLRLQLLFQLGLAATKTPELRPKLRPLLHSSKPRGPDANVLELQIAAITGDE